MAVIRDTLRRFDETAHMEALEKLSEWAAARQRAAVRPAEPVDKPTVPVVVVSPGSDADTPRVAAPAAEYVAQSAVQVPFARPWLADEADVEAYLSALRRALLDIIKAGKRVRI